MAASIDPSGFVPTEDTIEALIEHLVYPLLPIRESRDEMPTDHQQMIFAKQMHAVVILYNYYHRKQFSKLEFLGMESFCKLCCIAKPGILSYLRYMHSREEVSGYLNNQLSITEKMVMDACHICIELDSSKDNPKIEGWPISKVAVFLVDSTKKKCALQFCAITQGVWSLVEKVLEARYENRSSQNESCESEEMLEQHAFSAVEKETGISYSDLSILEHHLTYSLSHEKTTARLYIMKYGRALSAELTEVPIKDVIRSLKGPLVKKDSTCEVTSVVDYYNLLPYAEIISSWLSRENIGHDSLSMVGQLVAKEDKCSLEPNVIPPTEECEVKIKFDSNEPKAKTQNIKPNQSESLETNGDGLSPMNGSTEAASSPEERAGSPCNGSNRLSIVKNQAMNNKSMLDGQDRNVLCCKENNLEVAGTHNNGGAGGSLEVVSSCKVADSEQEQPPTMDDDGINKSSGSDEYALSVMGNKTIKTGSGTIKNINDLLANKGAPCAISKPENIPDVSQVEPDSLFAMKDQATKDKSSQSGQTKETEISKKSNPKDATTRSKISGNSGIEDAIIGKADSSPLNHFQQLSWSEDISRINIISDACTDKGKNSLCSVLPVSAVGYEDQAGMMDLVESKRKCAVEDRTYVSGANQDGCAPGDQQLVLAQSSSNDHTAFYHAMESKKNDLLQASLRFFQKKRDDLDQHKCLLQDEIARCEKIIQTILTEGEENPTLHVEFIIEALSSLSSSQVHFCMNPSFDERSPSQTIKRRKLSDAVLNSVNPCQELDDICHKNRWMLPRYTVFPSFVDGQITGMFKATVTLHGTDFECTAVGGDPKSSPREARESAATHMLNTLRKWQAKREQ